MSERHLVYPSPLVTSYLRGYRRGMLHTLFVVITLASVLTIANYWG